MSKHKVVEIYTTWAALKPQLKGLKLGAAKPQVACVHIGDGHITIDAVALRDWMQVVEGARFWFGMVDLPKMSEWEEWKPGRWKNTPYPARHLPTVEASTVDGQKLSARFYQKSGATDMVWQVYLRKRGAR